MTADPGKRRERPVVAIDGPAGSGKTTVARTVAERLGYSLVDTGAIYRCLALLARRRSVSPDDERGLTELAGELAVSFAPGDRRQRVLLEEEEVTDLIREPAISEGASRVSVHPGVRRALLGIQRHLGRDGGVVLEGRDIGTVVFPDAEVKVFLEASAEVRARRRFEEMKAKGIEVDLAATRSEMVARDQRDSNRSVAPLKPAADAVIIDTGPLSVDDVSRRVIELVRSRIDPRFSSS